MQVDILCSYSVNQNVALIGRHYHDVIATLLPITVRRCRHGDVFRFHDNRPAARFQPAGIPMPMGVIVTVRRVT